jgi:glycosyltransferase involved in cell wall biosynthesis
MTATYTLPKTGNSPKQTPLRATFVMEQHLGHGTFYQNLRRSLQSEKALETHWVEITYANSGAWWETLQFLPAHVRGTLCGRRQVRQGLRQQTNDIAFFNTQVPAVLGGRIIRRQPYMLCTDITPHQYDQMATAYGHRTDRHWLIKRYKHWANVTLFRQAKHIVPWSQWVRRSLIADYGVAADRITVIPPGVDTARWQPRPRGQHSGRVQILFVGGDFYRKGGEKLLQAFRALPAGSAQLALVTRSAIEPGEGVTVYNTLQPNSPELIDLYQRSDLFVLPTNAEAFGIAAVEAGAAGLPVIATNVGGVSDIVIDNHTGFLLPTNEADQLRARLLTLIEDDARRAQMGDAARKQVELHFDARKNAARILELLVAQHP